MKPFKVILNNGTASGFYILLEESEVKYTKLGETQPPNRDYKLQIAVEVVYNNKRCRGKKTFNVAKGTSIIKAVSRRQVDKQNMMDTLKEKGTLKVEKINHTKIDKKDMSLHSCYERFILKKKLTKKKNTIRVYTCSFNTHIAPVLGKMNVNVIKEDDIQSLIYKMQENKRSAGTIRNAIKLVLKQILEENDNLINWKKIELPKLNANRKYKKSPDITAKIVKAMQEYHHPVANGIFQFLLTGRRVTEVLYLSYDDVDFEKGIFTLRAKYTKANRDFDFALTPSLIKAIKAQKTTKGRIFKLEHRQTLEHFKNCMASIGIYDMVAHDIRSMVAQTALDAGADIYDVSKMLAHQKVSTTESSYIDGGAKQALKAQQVLDKTLKLSENIIDADIVEDKLNTLKILYPEVGNEVINYVFNILEKGSINN